MVNCLHGLGHNAVVGRYYQNGNIRCIGTTHTHSGKCFVSGCIEEGNLSVVDGYGISTDVLGNTACFPVGYVGLTDGIQKGCFTVVNVTHYADNGRTGNQIFIVFIIFLQQLFDNIDLDFLFAEDVVLHGDVFGFFIGNFLVYGNHFTL